MLRSSLRASLRPPVAGPIGRVGSAGGGGGGAPTTFTARDSAGTAYTVPLAILSSGGTSYTVTRAVLGSGGTSYTVS